MTKPRLIALGLTIITTVSVTVTLFTIGQEAPKSKELQKMLSFPSGAFELQEDQLLFRKRSKGWQLCRVKRIVWQDHLVVLKAGGTTGLVREIDLADSTSASEAVNGIFVVLQAALTNFTSIEHLDIDKSLIANLDSSDEFIVRAFDVRSPDFSPVP